MLSSEQLYSSTCCIYHSYRLCQLALCFANRVDTKAPVFRHCTLVPSSFLFTEVQREDCPHTTERAEQTTAAAAGQLCNRKRTWSDSNRSDRGASGSGIRSGGSGSLGGGGRPTPRSSSWKDLRDVAAISATADATTSITTSITRSIEEVTATDTIPIIAETATNSSDTRSRGTAATTGAAAGTRYALDRYCRCCDMGGGGRRGGPYETTRSIYLSIKCHIPCNFPSGYY
jgi:hypothetical protein